ncbi:MAG: UDP-glucose 4-epimerase GalE [Croceitalea sp.]|nr:UDP-glucose 4-epimerase GalE [Croceitalea sp.]
MSKILVTGGLGFIGSHTVVELQNEGFDVVIVDNLSNSTEKVLDGIIAITGKKPHFEKFDLRDKPKVEAFFSKHSDIAGVIHFAASKAVGESVENPLLYYENNLGVLVYILQELTKKGEANLIFSSSCTVYGQADTMPITEDAPVKPAESPYGNTKQVGEEIIRDTCNVNPQLAAIALRYFNPIGAHPTVEIGELPIGVPQNLLPYITQTGIGLRNELSVFGDDYPTPDGTCVRDYIHVVDLAKAHVAALKRLVQDNNDSNFEVFNLGTGTGSSVLDVINSFERVSGEKLNYRIAPRRAGDVVQAYADTKKANDVLGWKAQSTLDDAMKSAWDWEKKIRKAKTKLLHNSSQSTFK